jgi:protein required for attachment to host cells
MKKWIIVANKSASRIFEFDKSHRDLIEIADLINEKARMKESDLVSDSPGHSMDSGAGFGSRSLAHENKAVNHALEVYIDHVADFAKEGRNNNFYDSLILIAEPGMLGRLSKALEKRKLNISIKIGKGLNNLKANELLEVVENVESQQLPA